MDVIEKVLNEYFSWNWTDTIAIIFIFVLCFTLTFNYMKRMK